MQPVLTQVPPNRLRSIIATLNPAPASRTASGGPACPVPITIASYVVAICYLHQAVCCSYSMLRFYLVKLSAVAVARPAPITLVCACQNSIQRPGARADNHQRDCNAERKQVIFESFALLIAVPVHEKPVWPVHGNDGDKHDACDAECRNAGQESHGKPERAEEFRGDRQEGEDSRNTGARKILHGASEAVAAEPTERFLSAVRENHYRDSEP